MKKQALALAVALAMALSGCTVGPEEQPREPLNTPSETLPATLPTEPDAIATEPEPEPIAEPETMPEDHIPDEPMPDDETPDDGQDEPTDDYIEVDEVDVEKLYATISLNVRKGPTTDYDSIGHLDPGQEVKVVGYNYDEGWYLIEYGDGTGWVSGKYMSAEAPAVENTEEPEPIEIEMDDVYEMLESYAKTFGLPEVEGVAVYLEAYYGSYEDGHVAIIATVYPESDTLERHHDDIAGYSIFVPTGCHKDYAFYYYADGNFYDLELAYNAGRLTDNDMEKLEINSEGILYLGAAYYAPAVPDVPERPQPEPMSANAKATLIMDYAEYSGLDPSDVEIIEYYGSYAGGEAVVMWGKSLVYTDDLREYTVVGRSFTLASGNFDITIHTKNGEFKALGEAFTEGIITESDLDVISYYNGG